jgi:hypothetical protein
MSLSAARGKAFLESLGDVWLTNRGTLEDGR